MKKTLLLAILSVLSLTAGAANDGDTLYGAERCPRYYYIYSFEDFDAENTMHEVVINGVWHHVDLVHSSVVFSVPDSLGTTSQWSYCYPFSLGFNQIASLRHSDSILHVVGIAFIDMERWYPGTLENAEFNISLYDTNMNVIRSATVRDSNIIYGPHWKFFSSSFKEIYFPDTIDIVGDFYLSMTVHFSETSCQSRTATVFEQKGDWDNLSSFLIPYEYRKYKTPGSSGWDDEPCGFGHTTLIYPILAMTCYEVTGLHYEPVGTAGTMAHVQWSLDIGHDFYEISYGPSGTQPGEGTVIQTTQPRIVLSPLERNVRYDVYVRARCDFDTSQWSPWSDALQVHLATYGVDEVETMPWSLTPNPAHGSATVQCGEGIVSVELLTVKGEVLSRREAAGVQLYTIDLSGLARGVYIVRITTAHGTSARKLAVE